MYFRILSLEKKEISNIILVEIAKLKKNYFSLTSFIYCKIKFSLKKMELYISTS